MEINRRGFHRGLGKGLAAAGVATALGRARVAGANDRIGVGIIGHGGKGQALWRNFLAQPDVDAVAVADVYEPHLEKGMAQAAGKARGYKDFRQLLENRDVDAVIVATPDHWHAAMTVMACRAGKDVYCEKPLSLVVKEGRAMVNAARAHKRIVQTGSQQRSGAHYARAIQLVREGAIGDVHRVSVGFVRNVLPGFKPRDLPVDPASNLDWDMWLGPAPKVAFHPFRCLYHFRWFWDYSGGQMTNFGAHHLDIVRWALGQRAPTAVAGFGGRYALTDGGQTPDTQQVTYQFPGCVVTWTGSEVSRGGRTWDIEFFGSKGMLGLSRSGFKLTRQETGGGEDADVKAPVAAGPVAAATPASTTTAAKAPPAAIEEKGSDLDRPHIQNFLACCKSRAVPNADVEEGHLTATMCHLGNISTRLGRSLRWDAKKEEIVGDAEANRWLSKPYRRPWSLAAAGGHAG